MSTRFCSLYSGSSGNALYIAHGRTQMLIDAGLSGSAIEGALASIGARGEELSAILITHEHADHIQGAGVLARRFGVPIYANEKTWEAMAKKIGKVPPGQRRFFQEEQDFYVGDISVQPYSIPHDAADPVGYCLYLGSSKISVATDLGHTNARIIERLEGSDLLLLEANHDVDMLMRNTRYSAALKRRIRGSHGHLSNEQCAQALLELLGRGVRNVLLGHLSQENNAPELAYAQVCAALEREGVVAGRDIAVGMTWRDRAGELLAVQ